MGTLKFFLTFLGCFHCVLGIKYIITTPNTIRLGVEETIGISISEHIPEVDVQVSLQDHPGSTKVLAAKNERVKNGHPKITTLVLHARLLPELQKKDDKIYVKLIVKATKGEFPTKEVVLPVTKHAGYCFVQTDKPLYQPDQTVNIRIYRLDESLIPTSEQFAIEIMNPNGIRVMYRERIPDPKGLTELTFNFPTTPIFGNWSVTAHYGFGLSAKTKVRFEVKEYVLPIFSVEIEAPKVILDTDQQIKGKIKAKYVYGRPVVGVAIINYVVRNPKGEETSLGGVSDLALDEGITPFSLKVDKHVKTKIRWFPEIDKSVFIVKAKVIEKASGKSERAMDESTVFTTSPYSIDLSRSMQDFKPGVPYQVLADVRYINKEYLKEKITIEIIRSQAKKKDGNVRPLQQQQPQVIDDVGRVLFQFDTESGDEELSFTIRTKDQGLNLQNQATASLTIKKYASPVANTYIWISAPKTGAALRVGTTFQTSVYIYPAEAKISYLVTSKGKIVLINETTSHGEAMIRTVQFPVKADMVPSFRLLVYIIKNGKIIADSIQLEVQKTCRYNNGKPFRISATSNYGPNYGFFQPGRDAEFQVSGEPGSVLALTAVDEAVYLLNKRHILTKEKMFDEMGKHDLGHGPGGGQNPANVFDNAGILVLSNADIGQHGRKDPIVQAHERKKRESAIYRRLDEYEGKARTCCRIALEVKPKEGTNCSDRAASLFEHLNDKFGCVDAYLDCCQTKLKNLAAFSLARSNGGYHIDAGIQEIDDDDTEALKNLRKFFPETWFLKTFTFGDDECRQSGRDICKFKMTTPHSITSWAVQAVGISRRTGMCVADKYSLSVFQSMFIHLDLPTTATKGEQIEVMATIYNYEDYELKVRVYMYGVEGICMGAAAGEKSETREIFVPANEGKSVTFPVMPLKVGMFPIKVVALAWNVQDAIEKKLKVVAEGVKVEKTLSFPLDPTGIYGRRKKRDLPQDGSVSETFDDAKQEQNIKINLDLPEDHVPGTESCYVTAIGSTMGQSINTTLSGLEGKFMHIPTGCGEQTMIKLAPLVYTMTYLKKSNQLTAQAETQGYNYMLKGYAHQLTFKKQDGSYSVWASHKSSTWLTAFVAKTFCQANHFIKINEADRCQAISWMLQRQRDTGAFYDDYKVHHVEMTGGVQGDVTMTAYVLIAMLECTSCDSAEKRLAVPRAIKFLENHVSFNKRPYTIAMVAYALALANSEKAAEANEKLRSIAVFDPDRYLRYWSWDASEFGSGTKPWVYNKNPSAVAVETTSYALLAQLLHNDVEYSHPIVNWLNQQRSSSGSFLSTQDSVMALQALAEYNTNAKIPPLDITCSLISSALNRQKRYIILSQQNASVLQEAEFPAKGKLHIDVKGKGLGSMSVSIRYNVEQVAEETCKFDLSVKSEELNEFEEGEPIQPEYDVEQWVPAAAVRAIVNKDEIQEKFPYAGEKGAAERNRAAEKGFGGVNKHVVRLNICARYLGRENVGMSILDIGLFTGYNVKHEDISTLLQNKEVTKVSNVETSDRSVVLYLDTVPRDKPLCLQLRTVKEINVGKVQPTSVKIYDYYEPAEACTKFYGPNGSSGMLKPICVGKQCACLAGICPSCKPFEKISALNTDGERFDELENKACDKHNYVWNGTLVNKYENGSFVHYVYRVSDVMKPGIEDNLEDSTVTLTSRTACRCPDMEIGKVYIIMGSDGFEYKTEGGETKYKYVIDRTTAVFHSRKLRDIRDKTEKALQQTFNQLFYSFVEDSGGCKH